MRGRRRERLVERRGRGIARFGRGRRRPSDDSIEPRRDAGVHRGRPVALGSRRRREVAGGTAGQRAREREIEGETKRVDVRPGIAPPTRDDFRCRVGQRSGQGAGRGDAELPVELGGAEVREPGPAVRVEQNVLRLHVPVEDPPTVSRGQGGSDVASHSHGLLRRERPVLAHPYREVRARHVFHDDVAPRLLVEQVVDRDDVAVRETADRVDLAPEPLACQVGGRRRRHQQLHRHVAAHIAIVGLIDDGVATAADLAADLVAVAEQGAGREEGRRGHGLPESRLSTVIAFDRHPSSAL